MDPRKLYETAANDILCNTSYPLRPEYFSRYRSDRDIMTDTHELSFYFHIPFCRQLCKFCEYTRFISTGPHQENTYITKLKHQASRYLQTHSVRLLHGLDIGGGTPTALNIDAFTELLGLTSGIADSLPHSEDFVSSLEFSFSTLDEAKIRTASEHGIARMSTGIQVYDDELMKNSRRINPPLEDMLHKVSLIRDYGIKKINIDIMYGFEGLTAGMLENTIYVIDKLRPEHVTLYEMRYNVNHLTHQTITRARLYEQYSHLFGGLKSLGYSGRFGQNAFSLCEDYGVSSYLRSRMYDCVSYKGFGVSAQSMSRAGISYNILKSSHSRELPDFEAITEQDIYSLPPDEVAAKYVCIALYSGQFSLKTLSNILSSDAYSFYHDELDFLLEAGLITIDNDICTLTKRGFRVYGAIASLFWSEYHKYQYIEEAEA